MNLHARTVAAALAAFASFVTPSLAANYYYVDPGAGCDVPAGPNNVTQPFQTLAYAVTQCGYGDVVVANPGVYELSSTLQIPWGVSLQGVGARRCILREAANMSPRANTFVPDATTCGTRGAVTVLVDVSAAVLPFTFIDGFTFQGGDIQIYQESESDEGFTVSNCLFDLATEIEGVSQVRPRIGYEIVSGWNAGIGGYNVKRPNILNNDFLFGVRIYRPNHAVVDVKAHADSVGIVDVNDPRCYNIPNGFDYDPVSLALRGVNEPSVQNNLFRTLPAQSAQVVMLGLDDTDTSAANALGTSVPTNAFQAAGVGGSTPTPLYFSAIVGSAPVPQVDLTLVGGVLVNDPGFVGEFLANKVAGLETYRDFRIMEGSPLIDQGLAPIDVGGGTMQLIAKNGTTYQRGYGPNYPTPAYDPDFDAFDWDMEHEGNVRVHDADVDIGFDEYHSLIVAGSYSNEGCSHYKVNGPLDGPIPSGLSPDRWVFVRTMFANRTANVSANGAAAVVNPPTSCTPIAPAQPHDAWLTPVGMLSPAFAAALPVGYSTQFINFLTPLAPAPWGGTISPVISTDVNPINGATVNYCLFDLAPLGGSPLVITDAGPTTDEHFVIQASIRLNQIAHYTNAQAEYR